MSRLDGQLSALIASMDRSNARHVFLEIEKITSANHPEGYVSYIRSLINFVNFAQGKPDASKMLQIQMLMEEFKGIVAQAKLSVSLDNIFSAPEYRVKPNFLQIMSASLSLSPLHEVVLGIALHRSANESVRASALGLLRSKIGEILASPEPSAIPEFALAQILRLLRSSEVIEVLAIPKELIDGFVSVLRQGLPNPSTLVGSLLWGDIADSRVREVEGMDKLVIVRDLSAFGGLAKLMFEMGYSCCSSVQSAIDVINKFDASQLNSAVVAQVLGMMASNMDGLEDSMPLPTKPAGLWGIKEGPKEITPTWNVGNFVEALRDRAPSLNWPEVLQSFDYPGFALRNVKSLEVIMSAYRQATQIPVPLEVFFKPWRNDKGGLSVLDVLTNPNNAHHPDVIALLKPLTRRVVPEYANFKNVNVHEPLFLAWTCVGVVETLLILSEGNGLMDRVQAILTIPLGRCPEILAFTISKCNPKLGVSLYKLVLDALTKVFLEQSPNASIVLSQLFQTHSLPVLQSMVEYVGNDRNPTRLSRVLDVAQDIKALLPFLQNPNFRLAIEGAVMAAQREFVNLNVWLGSKFAQPQLPFVLACLAFLQDRMLSVQPTLSLEYQQVFLAHLQPVAQNLPQEAAIVLSRLIERHMALTRSAQPHIMQAPELNPQDPSVPGAVLPRKEVKEAANVFFEQIYSEKTSLDQCVARFRALQESANPFDQEVFDCMITSLFGEYRFLTQYPEKELSITANLFGVLVLNSFLANQRLLELMQMVLDAIGKDPASNVHRFGIIALNRFRERLREWPNYANRICQSPHFTSFPEELKIFCLLPKTGSAPPQRQPDPTVPAFVPAPSPSMEKSAFVPPVSITSRPIPAAPSSKEIEYVLPPAQVQEVISFSVNNLSDQNLRDKARDIQANLQPEYYDWFAHYLVVNRACVEPNFQPLYISLLEALEKFDGLVSAVLKETYKYIELHLKRHFVSGTSNQTDRNLLKHLGTWLGLQTLARNRPILYRDLPIKELLIQAYELGPNHLLIVVPFIAKVLDTGKQSKVFRPPNPWIMANLRILRELHLIPGMKLNLIFEVEVLCKAFGIKIEEVKPSEILKDIPQNSSPHISAPQPPQLADTPVGEKTSPIALESTQPIQNLHLAFPNLNTTIASIAQYIVANPTIPIFQQLPTMRQLIFPCLEKAITDATFSAAKSAKIASITTHRLLGKDFATDPDDNRIRYAALHMVQNLASSYATVSSREILRSNLATNLNSVLLQQLQSRQVIDNKAIAPYVDAICNDNLDLACAFMEKLATERAVVELDNCFAEELNDRRLYRESRSTLAYSSKLFKAPALVPISLLPKVGGPDPSQLAIYDRFFASFVSPAVVPGAQQSGIVAQPGVAPPLSKDDLTGKSENAIDKLLIDLERTIAQSATLDAASLPNIALYTREIMNVLAQSTNRTENACALAKKLFIAMMEVDESRPTAKLLKDTFFLFLVQLQDTYRIIFQDLTRDYNLLENPRKFDVDLVVRFLRARLLDASEIDQLFTKMLETSAVQVVIFVEDVLRGCLLMPDRPVHLGMVEFASSIDMLRKISTLKPRESLNNFIEALNLMYQAALKDSQLARNPAVRDEPGDPAALREICAYFFEEWNRISSITPRSEGTVNAFINKLMAQGLLKNEDISTRFFRVCTDFAIQLSPTGIAMSDENSLQTSYHGVDSYARLIIALLKFLKHTSKIVLVLSKVLQTLQAIVVRDHEIFGVAFNQKPYHRLFVNLLSEVHLSVLMVDESTTSQLVGSFAQVFHNLRPAVLPGFCFSWLSLISHRNFMPALLQFKSSKGSQIFQHLLVSLFNFMGTFLQGAQMTETIFALYKGTLRVLLVLMHDFPEFLCEFHFSLCDTIPPSCIQLRNLILSAYPRTTQLPNPFASSLKVDTLPETNIAPLILSAYTDVLQSSNLLNDLNSYVTGKGSTAFLHSLPIALLSSAVTQENTTAFSSKYNVRLINSLVLHVGILTIERLAMVPEVPNAEAPALDLLSFLSDQLDSEGKYHLFNAIANQLRYPNSHTKYFSHTLLSLFLHAPDDQIRELITRVMLERLIAFRPQPWGLLVTFIELIKNRQYNFWSYEFVRCDPEVERLFKSVSQSVSQQPGSEKDGVADL